MPDILLIGLMQLKGANAPIAIPYPVVTVVFAATYAIARASVASFG